MRAGVYFRYKEDGCQVTREQQYKLRSEYIERMAR